MDASCQLSCSKIGPFFLKDLYSPLTFHLHYLQKTYVLAVSSCQFLLNLLVPFPLQAKKEQQDKFNQINIKETYHNCYRYFLPINGNQTKPIQYLKRDTSTVLSFQI